MTLPSHTAAWRMSLLALAMFAHLGSITHAQVPPPRIDFISPDRGWPGGTRADGTTVPGTRVVIEGLNFNVDPSLNSVTFAGPDESRISAPVVWASPSALHYSPAGILDDSANFIYPLDYVEGFHRSEGIAVWRESVGDRFYATFPTLETSGAIFGSLGTVKYPLYGFNGWTMLNFSSFEPYLFDRPTGIAVDDDGRVYVTNRLEHRVETYTSGLGSNSDQAAWGSEGSGANEFDEPHGIDVIRLDGENSVFVADTGNNRVVRTRDDGTAFTAFVAPAGTGPIEGIAAHSSGVIYATDREQGRLMRFDARSGDSLGFFGAADLTHPRAVDVDLDGFVYVIDGRWVKKFEPSGALLSRFGYTDSGDPLEVLPEEALEHPKDLAVTGGGNVLVVDSTLFDGHVARWAPSDARELWVHVPEGAQTGDLRVQTASGSDDFFFTVLQPGPISVEGWSVNQGIDEYPLVAGKKTAIVAELSTPPNPDPFSLEINTFGSPVTDTVELVVERNGTEIFRTEDFEVDAIASGPFGVEFMLVSEVPTDVIATPASYSFTLSLAREGELDFSDTSTRQVTRRRSPRIGAVVLSHLRFDGSPGLGDPPPRQLFPIPSDDDVFVSWFDLREMYRGFLEFNRYYPVPTRVSNVGYLGAMPIPGIADGVTDANASELLTWLEGVRITLNIEGNDFETLIGLFDRQLVDPEPGEQRWIGRAAFNESRRAGLVTIGDDELDTTVTRADIGMVFAHEVGHVNGAVPPGPRQDSQAHSIFDTVQSERTGWNTRVWTFVGSPQSIMDGAELDLRALLEGPVVDREGVTDGGDWGHLFGVFANPHPTGDHYIESPLSRTARPSGSTSNINVTGVIDGGTASLYLVQVGPGSSAVSPDKPSKYKLVQYDAGGIAVGRWPVHPSSMMPPQGTAATRDGRMHFRVTAPFFAHTGLVALELNGRRLTSVRVPATGPSLELVSFSPSNDDVTMRWRATHAGRSDLVNRVEYSVDNGDNFRVIGLLEGAETTIPYSALAGSQASRLRIVASDGFNSASLTSPAFTVPNKPPRVHILLPEDGALATQTTPVRAQAYVTDKEDGLLVGTSVEWILDGHIPMCNGTECRVDEILVSTGVGALSRVLPLGAHTLTARATDSGGLTSETSIVFSIGRDSDGDGISDDAEEQSGTDPADVLDAPGLVRFRHYFDWPVGIEELIRQFRLINPEPNPLVTRVWLTRADGGSLPRGGYEISDCSGAHSGELPAGGRIRVALAANEACAVRVHFRGVEERMRIDARVGLESAGAKTVRLTVNDERDGLHRCWFLPRWFGICGPATRELRLPAPRVSTDPDIEPPVFDRLSDMGALMRAAALSAPPQDPERRTRLWIRSAEQALASELTVERVDALTRIAAIGRAADRLLPGVLESTFGTQPAERAAAATAIGRMGAAASPYAPRLRELLEDPDERVAQAARTALARLTGEAARSQ